MHPLERIKQSKQKSVTEVVEEAPIAEVPEPCPVKDSSDDEFKEFRIIPDNFKSVSNLKQNFAYPFC